VVEAQARAASSKTMNDEQQSEDGLQSPPEGIERDADGRDVPSGPSALRAVCVYCGSNFGTRDRYRQAAVQLGRLLAERGLELVDGGGRVGLMGVIADAALAAGGRVLGVIPESLALKEVAHSGLTELREVQTMHERKALMAARSDAFVALPGGLGTLDELFEIVTWSQLGVHDKPCGLLDVDDYYQPLLTFLDRQVAEGFVRPEHRELLLVDDDPGRLLERMAVWQRPRSVKWIDQGMV
jgi:hypothetical protein